MKKNERNERADLRGGDFPGLDGGPVSAEHERRFLTNGPAGKRNTENGAPEMLGIQNASNHAKEEARPS